MNEFRRQSHNQVSIAGRVTELSANEPGSSKWTQSGAVQLLRENYGSTQHQCMGTGELVYVKAAFAI